MSFGASILSLDNQQQIDTACVEISTLDRPRISKEQLLLVTTWLSSESFSIKISLRLIFLGSD